MTFPRITIGSRSEVGDRHSLVVWVLLLLLLSLGAANKRSFLGEHFFYDAQTISDYAHSQPEFSTVDSFETTAAIYVLMGIKNIGPVPTILQTLAIVAIICAELLRGERRRVSISNFFAIVVISFFAFVYLTDLSKDFWALLIAFFLPRRLELFRLIFWISLVVLYAIFFRKYWVIVLGFTTIFVLLNYKKLTAVRVLAAGSLAAILVSLTLSVVLGADISSIREEVNTSREIDNVVDMRTAISPPIPALSGVFSSVNVFLIWLTLAFPVPLLFLARPYYIVLFFSISFLFLATIRKTLALSRLSDQTHRETLQFSLIAGFTLTLAIFEPDYGSYLRHMTAMLPIFIRLLSSEEG